MKKLKKALKELWLDRYSILQALAYIITIGWYGLVLRHIINCSNISLFPAILLFIGGIALGFFTCFSLHKLFNADDDDEK